jgi:hypothetical protein
MVDIDAKDKDGDTALLLVACMSHKPVVELLLALPNLTLIKRMMMAIRHSQKLSKKAMTKLNNFCVPMALTQRHRAIAATTCHGSNTSP